MTFEDCELVSTLGTLIYVWDNTYKHNVESYTMSFKNCDFKTTETRSVFTFFGTECAVSFEGCNFAAAFNETNNSKLTFDDKCKFLYNYPADAIIADGLSFIEYPTEEKLAYSYNVFKVNGDRTGFLPESYTDFTVVDKTVSYKYIIDSADGITATINWVDAEGNVLETTTVAKNSTVAPPTVTIPVGDGWRNVKVVDWKNADGKVDYAIGSDNEYTFTAIIPEGEEAEYTVGITGALHNLTYYAHFRFNVYLPVTEGVSIVSTNYTKLSNVMIDGVEYYHYSAYPTTATAGRDYTMNLTYEIDGQQFKCDFTIGILVYAKYILNDTNSSAEELELVKAMLRYVEQAYIAAGNTVPAALSSLVKAYPAAAYPTVYPDADVNYDAIAEYVDTVALGVNGNQARYVITVPRDVAVAGFTVDVREFTTEKVEQADGSLIFRTKNSKVYDLTNTVNIDVYNSDGELVATAPYSAGAYINATDSVLAKATYAFGEAILAYVDSIE
jgi:hypothetical protein